MRMVLEYSREDLDALQYAVIVEMWDYTVGSSSGRRTRLLFENSFTGDERATLKRYYTLFYDWYTRRGTPAAYKFEKMEDVYLIKRATNFFGTA